MKEMATQKKTANPEFLYIPVGNIVVLEQVRSNINIETDSFKSLMQSIKDKGILEPLLVTGPVGDSYTLLCGERRLAAARQLGLESVPVRVIESGKGYDVDGVMGVLVSYNRRPEDVSEEIALTVRAIVEISGKSTQTLHRAISLLKLSDEMQAAIWQENLPVSQGYLFATNLDCPDLMKAVNGE
jgi:hypothetical protein